MTLIENEFTELKSTLVSDICKNIIAFANTKGCTLNIGVGDDGTWLEYIRTTFLSSRYKVTSL